MNVINDGAVSQTETIILRFLSLSVSLEVNNAEEISENRGLFSSQTDGKTAVICGTY